MTLLRNGSISRDSLPLWKGRKQGSASGAAVDKVGTMTLHRNGSISRDSLPLWKEVVERGAGRRLSKADETPMCQGERAGADGADIGKIAGGVYVRR